MPLPNIPVFQDLLDSFTVARPASDENCREFIAVPKEQVIQDGRRMSLPAISFWYREIHGLSLESLLKKISTELSKAGHKANLELAATVTAIFALSKSNGIPAVERFNMLFEMIVDSDLNQFALFSSLKVQDYCFRVGSFRIGPFDVERLAYQSRKSGSDFFARYEKQLRQMPFSVERVAHPTKVIFWHRLFAGEGPWHPRETVLHEAVIRSTDCYFAQLSSLNFKTFFEDLHTSQEIPMSLGSGWFAVHPVDEMLGAHLISIYLKIGGENVGFVSPAFESNLTINLGGGHLGVPFTESYLLKHFNFRGSEDCAVHKRLRTYCHFLALGAEHRLAGRQAEGFLHCVIALDLLLGAEGSSTASVSTHGAALVHRAFGRSYFEVLKDLQLIYNARSKYVHEGRLPESSLADLVETLCREVAFCLFRLQRDAANRMIAFSERWVKDIDFVVASITANRALDDDDLRRVGAWVEGDSRHSEFYTALRTPPATNLASI